MISKAACKNKPHLAQRALRESASPKSMESFNRAGVRAFQQSLAVWGSRNKTDSQLATHWFVSIHGDWICYSMPANLCRIRKEWAAPSGIDVKVSSLLLCAIAAISGSGSISNRAARNVDNRRVDYDRDIRLQFGAAPTMRQIGIGGDLGDRDSRQTGSLSKRIVTKLSSQLSPIP